jgi:hypothetical protein
VPEDYQPGECLKEGRKYSLRRPRKRQDNNIKVAVKGMGWMGMDWINLDQDKNKRWAFWNIVTNIQVLENAEAISTR